MFKKLAENMKNTLEAFPIQALRRLSLIEGAIFFKIGF